jgi:hypothetical protein
VNQLGRQTGMVSEEPGVYGTIILRLPREINRAIRKLARENDRPLNAEITRAVREYVLRQMGEGSKSA